MPVRRRYSCTTIPISTFVNFKGGVFHKKRAYYSPCVQKVEYSIVKVHCFAVRQPVQRFEAVVC